MTTEILAPIEPFERWIDDDPLSGRRLFRPLVYWLQRRVLPGLLFAERPHPEVQRLFGPGKPRLDHFWVRSSMICEDDWPDAATDSKAFYEYMSGFTSETGAETFTDAQFEICVVTMPKPVTTPEASFVALCRPSGGAGGDGSSSSAARYFTVERTVEPSLYCFCEWTREGKHLNLGQVGVLSKAAFLQRVRERLTLAADERSLPTLKDVVSGSLDGASVSFGITVWSAELARVGELLGQWAGGLPIRHKVRVSGEEIDFENDWFGIYGHLTSSADGTLSVVTGSIAGNVDAIRPKLQQLHDLLKAAGFRAQTDYQGLDAEGEPTTEELYLE